MTTALCYRRREKMFGEGRLRPLDRNAKARIMVLARALSHRTEKGKHYGAFTAKFLAVLEALRGASTTPSDRPVLPELRAHRGAGRAAPARPSTRPSTR